MSEEAATEPREPLRSGGGQAHRLFQFSLAVFLLNALASLTFTAISVATPYIGAALSVGAQEELWLTDAFLIALICVTPVSGFFAAKVGVRPLLLGCAAGTTCFFTAGVLVQDLTLLTGLCFLAGLCSGMIVPTTQTIVVERYPGEKRRTAMAIWGAGTTTGILLGAALTGLALEQNSWQYVFLLAWPLGLGALVATWATGKGHSAQKARTFSVDVVETASLLTSLLALSIFINLGDNMDWFRSKFMIAVFVTFGVTAFLYVQRARHRSRGILDLYTLRNASFAAATFLTFGIAFFSTGQFQIDMLGGPLHTTPSILSLRSSLGAAALLGGVVLGGLLLKKLKTGSLVTGALMIVLVGKVAFTHYTLGTTPTNLIWPQVVTGFGLGLLTTPLAMRAYRTLAPAATKDAASLFSLATQLGSGFGIALLGIVLNYFQNRTGDAEGAALEPFLSIFWLELAGTALLLLAAFILLFRPPSRHG